MMKVKDDEAGPAPGHEYALRGGQGGPSWAAAPSMAGPTASEPG